MVQHLLASVYERMTGRPYYTTRCASAEFGPPAAAVYADELACLSGDALDRRWAELKAIHARRRQAVGTGSR